MTLNFNEPELHIGNAGTPPLQFFKRGFNLGSSGSTPSWQDIVLSGNGSLSLTNAKANGLNYLKLYGGCEQRNLPSGYTEYDGLIGDGTAYIDLDCTLTQDDEIELEFTKTSNVVSKDVFGARTSASSNNISVILAVSGNVVEDFNNSDYTDYRLNTAVSLNTRYKVVMNKTGRYLYQGDTLVVSDTTANSDTITTTGCYLFSLAGTGLGSKFQGTIHRCLIKGKRDVVPCGNGAAYGMYDKLNSVFYPNANTEGSFTVGNAAVPTPQQPLPINCNNGVVKVRHQSGLPLGYQMVEWLIPTGAISITGFKTKSTQEIETVFYREGSGMSYLYASDTVTSGTSNTTAYLTNGGGQWRWDGKTYSISVSVGTKVTSIQNKYGVWLNDTRLGWYSNAEDFVSTNDLRLSSSENTTIRIYSQTIREGEITTLDLVPVQRLSDSIYGFYDKVSGEFYTNTEATFVVGDVIDDPVEIYTDGTVETVEVYGKNLFDQTTATRYRTSWANSGNGAWQAVSDSSEAVTYGCYVNPNTTYTLSKKGGARLIITGYTTKTEPSSEQTTPADYKIKTDTTETIDGSYTFTTPADCTWILFGLRQNNSTFTFPYDVQLELGSTATEYEPYFNGGSLECPMLLSVGS